MNSILSFLKQRSVALPLLGLLLLGAIGLALSPAESLGVALERAIGSTAAQVAQYANVTPPASQTALAAPESYENAVVAAVDRSMPAVVAIVATKDVPVLGQCAERNGRTTYYVPCQQGTRTREVGGGSGFFVSADGLVLTNKHVVDDTSVSYTVFTTDGKSYPATVLKMDPVEDLAVLKVQGSGFPTLSLGDSSGIKLGQTAIAIGNALGEFRNTVSVGVISGLDRTVTARDVGSGVAESLTGVIQTDAAINPGNSGGPLLNLQGQVIGINIAVADDAQGIGFALPASQAQRLVGAAKTGTKIAVPYLGIRYMDSPDGGVVLKADQSGPAVAANSPAAAAGLKAGDRITAIGGKTVSSSADVQQIVNGFDIGQQVSVTVIRNGATKVITVTVGSRS